MTVQIGTIFSCSWGYEQTNVDFYEVVKVTKASVVVREIGTATESSDGNWTGYARPCPGNFLGEPMTKRLATGWDGGPRIKIKSYASAGVWDGQPQRFTSYA